jgi:hypothetical protein
LHDDDVVVDLYKRAGDRYRSLIRQLEAEQPKEAPELAPQKYAAQQAGVKQSTLSKIMNGARSVGGDVISRAIGKLAVSSAFFFDDFTGTPHYRDHLTKLGEPAPEDPSLTLFLQTMESVPEEKRPTEMELSQLRAWRPPEGFLTDEDFYFHFFQGLRYGLSPIVSASSAQRMRKLRKGAKGRGHKPPSPKKRRS